MKNNYSIQNLLEDIARGAEVDRAAGWLEVAADDYPKIFGVIRDNLDKPPVAVLAEITAAYPILTFAVMGLSREKTCAFIGKLQTFYKKRGY